MSLKTAIAVTVIVCLACVAALPPADAQGMPHAIIGTVSVKNGPTVGNATVTLTNPRTDATLITATNELGQYQADLSSMAGGFQVGDTIRVTAVSSNSLLEGSSSVTVTDNALDECDVVVKQVGVTSPSWDILLVIIAVIAIIVLAYVTAYMLLKGNGLKEPPGKRRRRK